MKSRSVWFAGAVTVTAAALAVLPLSSVASAATKAKVTIHAGKSVIDLGTTVHFTGTVTPSRSGARVALQRFYQSKWHTVASATPHSGRYDVSVKPTTPGRLQYRTVWLSAGSAAAYVTAYKWHYLSDLTPVQTQTCCGTSSGQIQVDGTLYIRGVSWGVVYNGGDQWVEWNLSRKCTELRGAVGVTDDSDNAEQIYVEISTDGLPPTYTHTYPFGTHTDVSVDITSALRLRINSNGVASAVGYGTLGLGDAQIRCAW
jgi:hypothetical protein